MIDPKASQQPKRNAIAEPKLFSGMMATKPDTSKEMIRERAYELYESRGREHGRDEQDWFRAEQQILNQA